MSEFSNSLFSGSLRLRFNNIRKCALGSCRFGARSYISLFGPSAGMWTCVLLALLMCSLLAPTCGLTTEEELPPASSQEALGLIASLQQPQEGSSNELRRLANMYELLQLAAYQQHQRQRLPELEEHEGVEGEEYPLALPLQGHIAALQDKDEYLKDKRGSYMSLCHFKICNMGRKRSSYWNSWARN